MAKEPNIELIGIVERNMSNGFFLVKVEKPKDHEVICQLSGKLRQNKIMVLEGDAVKIEVSMYDLSKGRIVWRDKK